MGSSTIEGFTFSTLKEFRKKIRENNYRLQKPIEVESYPIKSEKTNDQEKPKKLRTFIIIKPLEFEEETGEVKCSGHKTKEVKPGVYKNNEKRYLFSLKKEELLELINSN